MPGPGQVGLRLGGHGDWLNPAGHVKVDRMLRVEGFPNVFAVGATSTQMLSGIPVKLFTWGG